MKVCVKCGCSFGGAGWNCPICCFMPVVDGNIPLFSPELAESNDGFSVEYFDELEQLEAGNFWFRARNELIISVLRKYCPSMRTFMELGCGTGFVMSAIAKEFPDAEITGTEIFSKGLIHASARVPRAELIQVDAQNLPYLNHIEVIGAFDVLEHIKDDGKVLGQLYEALIPGGMLFLTVPQHEWLWSEQDKLACHVRRYSSTEMSAKVIAAGFSISHTRSFVSLLLPFLWLSRRRNQVGKRPDALRELRIGSRVNRILEAVMQLEFLLCSVGMRFPVGGSLLLVARKAGK